VATHDPQLVAAVATRVVELGDGAAREPRLLEVAR
jgi:ABC-type ATPase involved in cell division